MLAAVFAATNLAVYTTVDRIGLALAITLEFLGPLSVALLASRTRRDLLTAIATAGGVYVLVLPGPSSDLLGLGIGLFSAGCWAGYILLNRLVGARLPGLQGTALATTISATGYLPVLAVLAASGRLTPKALGYAIAAGTLASIVPYSLDLIVLRNVPTPGLRHRDERPPRAGRRGRHGDPRPTAGLARVGGHRRDRRRQRRHSRAAPIPLRAPNLP
jgi:inner membrane transporter RhtA